MNIQTAKLLSALCYKDAITFEHSIRVGRLAAIVFDDCCELNMERETFIIGCLLHDIGKLMIPDNILRKSTFLTDEEWAEMRSHPNLGESLINKTPYFDNIELKSIILYHHERWDGSGYPLGLKENEIPISARICSIIDAFDCMVSDRQYQKGMSISNAKIELYNNCWTQFDGNLVSKFLNISDHNFESLYKEPRFQQWVM